MCVFMPLLRSWGRWRLVFLQRFRPSSTIIQGLYCPKEKDGMAFKSSSVIFLLEAVFGFFTLHPSEILINVFKIGFLIIGGMKGLTEIYHFMFIIELA